MSVCLDCLWQYKQNQLFWNWFVSPESEWSPAKKRSLFWRNHWLELDLTWKFLSVDVDGFVWHFGVYTVTCQAGVRWDSWISNGGSPWRHLPFKCEIVESLNMKRNSRRKASTSVPTLCCKTACPERNVSRENSRVITICGTYVAGVTSKCTMQKNTNQKTPIPNLTKSVLPLFLRILLHTLWILLLHVIPQHLTVTCIWEEKEHEKDRDWVHQWGRVQRGLVTVSCRSLGCDNA